MVFLRSDAAVAQEECVKDLALFAEVPDGDAPRLASALGLLAGPIALKGKTKEYLGTVTTAAMLHVAARAIHSECPYCTGWAGGLPGSKAAPLPATP